jgi:6-phosphogluconolactonase (cycloisomerase 2 family)
MMGFGIDQDTGALTEISSTDMASNVYWSISPNDKYIFVCGPDANYTLYVYEINQTTGALLLDGTYIQADATMMLAHPVATPDSQFLYVSDSSNDTIAGFSIGTDGTLAQLDPAVTSIASNTTPEKLLIHPDGTFLLVETDQGVTVFSINLTTGALTEVDYVPILDLGMVPYWVFHPDGGYLFHSGSEEIGIYSFNSATGALSATGNNISLNYEGISSFQAISPDGLYLVAVSNTNSDDPGDQISIFEFDGTTGTATELSDSPYALGNILEWTHLVAVELPPAPQ